jgi:hypothetical protein
VRQHYARDGGASLSTELGDALEIRRDANDCHLPLGRRIKGKQNLVCDSAHFDGGGGYVRAAPGAVGGGPDVELVPEDVRVSATIDGRFVAGVS